MPGLRVKKLRHMGPPLAGGKARIPPEAVAGASTARGAGGEGREGAGGFVGQPNPAGIVQPLEL